MTPIYWTFFSLALFASRVWADPFAFGDEKLAAELGKVKEVCAADARKSECGAFLGPKRGLVNCLHDFQWKKQQTDKGFLFSPNCEVALEQLRKDREARSASRPRVLMSTMPPTPAAP